MNASQVRSARTLPATALRTLARLAAEAAAVGFLASLVLLVACLAITSADAAPVTSPATGRLLFKTETGSQPALALATDVQIEVTGIVARARVTQRFVNPSSEWREAVYVFPLPEGAAVDRLAIEIGERRIQGVIKERAQAKQAYERAKQEGRKAALVEQERPNLFTTSVAPIGPDEEIRVVIEYQETLRFNNGAFSLRFPFAITPRYLPGPLAEAPGEGALPPGGALHGGLSQGGPSRVEDAQRIAAPFLHPDADDTIPATLSVRLNAGFPLASVHSSYHTVSIDEAASGEVRVILDGPVPADRDFELSWQPDIGRTPGATVLTQQRGERSYALLMLAPPSATQASTPRQPREVTFVIDTSGSMAGTSIVQAKSALMYALDRLQPGDAFNVIEFNSSARALFARPMPVDRATLGRARSFASRLHAQGGTEMRQALDLALASEPSGQPVRQVVFMTDGAVGNESELFALIHDRLADRRLFTVGIGSAPNSHFMTKAAQFGRGTFTYIGNVQEVHAKMAALFVKLESPVLTDVEVEWPGSAVEAWPARVPDLYAGEPIVITAALPSSAGDVVVRGRLAGAPWRATLPLVPAGSVGSDDNGLDVLWARAKIEALSDRQVAGEDADVIRGEIVKVALEHQLVSTYTSLVAVDVTPTAPPGMSKPVRVPGQLPHGQLAEAFVGGLPQTATPATLSARLAALLALLCAGVVWHGGRGRDFATKSPVGSASSP